MDGVNVHVEVEINPTESEEKVKRAVENTFGGISVEIEPRHKGSLLVAEGEGLEALEKLYNLVRRERIRNAARGVLFKGLEGNAIRFCLNKQAAYAGHVSFAEELTECPLGPMKVRIKCDNPRELINWLAPKV